VVGLMMWMWLSTIVVLVGAELNSEVEHQTARDSTVGREKPLGARGAVMADTVGELRPTQPCVRRRPVWPSAVHEQQHHPDQRQQTRLCIRPISHHALTAPAFHASQLERFAYQSATTNAHPIIGIFPAPSPPEGTDPVNARQPPKTAAHALTSTLTRLNDQEPREVMQRWVWTIQ
jgi:hypothetical protein